MLARQKVLIVVLCFFAYLLIIVPTVMKSQISVLQYAYFAYTMYGVAVTPALFAALTWKRATWQGGVASIVGGAVAAVFFEFVLKAIAPGVMEAANGLKGPAAMASNFGADPWGIPSIYPSAIISIGLLVVVSLLTPKPDPKTLERLFGPGESAGRP
jgi:Na+/proline symporter